jgi:hypothetical protein
MQVSDFESLCQYLWSQQFPAEDKVAAFESDREFAWPFFKVYQSLRKGLLNTVKTLNLVRRKQTDPNAPQIAR